MNDVILKSLSNVTLELVDVGASGETWETFRVLKCHSRLLRFDPDERDFRISDLTGDQEVCINRAVTELNEPSIELFLTEFPYCSSTLEPDLGRIKCYPYIDWFTVKKKISVPAITLSQGLEIAKFTRPDWIKIDTQGTELRIVQSLPKATLDQVLIFEIEASIYPHYKKADTVGAIFDFFEKEEFWIVKTVIHDNTRCSKVLNEEIGALFTGMGTKVYNHFRHREPTTFELFYARTLDGCQRRGYSKDDYMRLFLCHYSLGTLEYCLEILDHVQTIFGDCKSISELRKETLSVLKGRVESNYGAYIIDSLKNRALRFLRAVGLMT
jgi:FkbM family methyltransferase